MDHKYTFNPSTRYITRGISELVPLEIQLLMWAEIDKLIRTTNTLDYLQVFEFKVKDYYMELEHRQEVPEYKQTHKLKLMETYHVLDKVKIYVIDDIDHSTMLLSSEY